MAQLAQLLELRPAFAHVLEGLAPHVELAGLEQRPADAFAREIGGEALHVEGPVAGGVADVDAVLRVDRRHHGVAHRAPGLSVGKLGEHLHVDRNAAVLHQRGHGGKFAVVERDAEIDFRQHVAAAALSSASTSLAQ